MRYESRSKLCLVALPLLFAFTSVLVAQEPKLELKQGDHISYIGNNLADRMQHAGWLESIIQSRFAKHQLVFRNLGFTGDTITLRPRSASFGSPETWLTKTKTDVVFAFFGFNESRAGEAGLAAFKDQLRSFVDDTRKAKYNGKTAPRLVLFSPIASEDLKSPHLPDGKEANARLAAYTKAMSEVAAEKKVPFVNLFAPSLELYADSDDALTMNGIHLTPEGNRQIAAVITNSLFGREPIQYSGIEKIRQAVLDKNLHWFSRYRTVDGYNVYGGRSTLNWFGQSNADVMKREMEIFDVMTANRDRRVWAIANGGSLKVDDRNTPPLLKVKTNRPGPLEGGTYPFLGGREAIGKMKLAKGMQVNLFASEEQFPDLINPVQMSVDADGRLWVATWPTYPHWNPKEPMGDKIVILPDDNGDGKADRLVVFADKLNSVTGFEFWGGGILVAAAPEILFLKDTDGDDKADVKIRMLQGVSSADSHHSANSLVIGPDGGLYYSRGIFNYANMETPTKTFRSGKSGVYRFDPRTFEIDFHFPIGPNPHGDCFDQWGYQFASDGTGGTGSYINIGKGERAKQWYRKRVRPVPATGFLSSSHFPKENDGNFLICNAIGVLGVLQHKVEYSGADINAVEIEPLLLSSDPNFRPTDIEVGGDGALYISDWCNPLIGHMQHNIRDPNRDHRHGRVYRLTVKGRDLLKPVKMKGKPVQQVFKSFYAKETGTRYRARLELSGRKTSVVTNALSRWAAEIEPNTAADEQALLESLWVFEEHRVPNETLLRKVLRAKEPRVRAAAIRTLGHWGPKIAGWEEILLAAARDKEPLVRAQAVVAAPSFTGVSAAEAIFEVANRPTDVQLDHVLSYSRSQIKVDKLVEDAIKKGKPLSKAAFTYVLRNANVNDLLKMERSELVYQAILDRPNVPVVALRQSLTELAKIRKQSAASFALELIESRDSQKKADGVRALTPLLVERSAGELSKMRDRLVRLTRTGQASATRQAGYASWIAADQSADDAFLAASKSKDALRDLLAAVPLIVDSKIRAGTYSRVRSLMFELPAGLKPGSSSAAIKGSGIRVDYFYPSADNVAIETLARMKPQASGIVPEITMNVPQRKEKDKFALRFTGTIQINRAGNYTFFTRSDDGSRLYIGKRLVVNNDGLHGLVEKRGSIQLSAGSHPLVVTYFDNGGGDGLSVSWRGPGFRKQRIPGSRLAVGGGESLHDVAIRSLISIPGHEKEKFNDLARLIKAGSHRTSAISAIGVIPEEHWAKSELRALADNLVAYLSEIPAAYRTGPTATSAVKLAKRLAKKLPAKQSAGIEKRLANLDVRVIAIGTVPHRMNYDKEKIAVQAGKPVEFRFSNSDNMPHNFAIVQPGSMEEIGLMAEATARDADAEARQYLPKSNKILLGSRLLQPGESQAISFEAPSQPGIYPYVCTYPGHWRRMYGALYVVENLADYRADPNAYLAAHPLPIRDEMLKLIGRETNWKFADLAASVDTLPHGRSFDVGKQLFKVTSCVACHRLNNVGNEFGPDLSKLDLKKNKPTDVLRSMLEPSHKIEDKYLSYVFQLDSGKVVTGMIVKQTPQMVEIVENPLAKAKSRILPRSSIEAMQKSPKSIMPEGLLSKLKAEEIVDLVAYVFARGDKKHMLFKDHKH